jgi:hypothetical protein
MTGMKHGMYKSTTYGSWKSMKARCSQNQAGRHNYSSYGERGIKVCKRWMKFENFLADMGKRPEGMTIDRKNSNKGYYKNNCQWSAENVRGLDRKIRSLTSAKLKPDQIPSIRIDTRKTSIIAAQYGLSTQQIRRVQLGISWKNIS